MATPLDQTIVKLGRVSAREFAESDEDGDWQYGTVTFTTAFPSDAVHVILTPTSLGLDSGTHAAAVVGVVQKVDRHGFRWAVRNSDMAAGSAGFYWVAVFETPGVKATWEPAIDTTPRLDLGRFQPKFLTASKTTGDWVDWKFSEAKREISGTSIEPARFPVLVTASGEHVSGHTAAAVGIVQANPTDPSGAGFQLAARNSDCMEGACGFSYVAFGSDLVWTYGSGLEFHVVEAGDVHAQDFGDNCRKNDKDKDDWQFWNRICFKHPGFYVPPVVLVTANGRDVADGLHNPAVVGMVRNVTCTGFELYARNSDVKAGLAGFDWVAFGLPGSDATWQSDPHAKDCTSSTSHSLSKLTKESATTSTVVQRQRLIRGFLLLPPVLLLVEYLGYLVASIVAGQDLHTVNQVFGAITPVLVISSAVALVGGWLLSLLETVRRRRWRWFTVVLLLPYLGALAYSLRRPKA